MLYLDVSHRCASLRALLWAADTPLANLCCGHAPAQLQHGDSPLLVPPNSRTTRRPFLHPSPWWDGGTAFFSEHAWAGGCVVASPRSDEPWGQGWGAGMVLAGAVLQLIPTTMLQARAGCPVGRTSDPEGNALQLPIPHNLVVENPNYKFRFLLAGMIWKKVVIIKRWW